MKFSVKNKDYTIIRGNSKVLLIKVGLNEDIQEEKYITIADNLNKKYGVTVFISANDGKIKNLDKENKILKEYFNNDEYEILYMGYSNGGYIGGVSCYKYPKIKKILLINPPMMFDFDVFNFGIKNLKDVELTLVVGTEDQMKSKFYLLDEIENENIKIEKIFLEGIDHKFTDKLDIFISVPEMLLN